METIITLVLGMGLGGLIIMIISSFMTTLRIKKEVAELHKNVNNIEKYIDDVVNMVRSTEENANKRVNEDIREISNRVEELNKEIMAHINQRTQDDYNNLRALIEETSRYVDSRVDKTVDALCLRMDTVFVQQKNDTTILKS